MSASHCQALAAFSLCSVSLPRHAFMFGRVGLYLFRPHWPPRSPGIPIFLRLFHDSYSFIPGPFNLGRATKPLAAIACAWILLVSGVGAAARMPRR